MIEKNEEGLYYFWDELGDYCFSFFSKWEAEKAFSLYCFDVRGCGENDMLYLNTPVAFMFMQRIIERN